MTSRWTVVVYQLMVFRYMLSVEAPKLGGEGLFLCGLVSGEFMGSAVIILHSPASCRYMGSDRILKNERGFLRIESDPPTHDRPNPPPLLVVSILILQQCKGF